MTKRERWLAVALSCVPVLVAIAAAALIDSSWGGAGVVLGTLVSAGIYARSVRKRTQSAGTIVVDGQVFSLSDIQQIRTEQGALVVESLGQPPHLVRNRDEYFWLQLRALPGFTGSSDVGSSDRVLWKASA